MFLWRTKARVKSPIMSTQIQENSVRKQRPAFPLLTVGVHGMGRHRDRQEHQSHSRATSQGAQEVQVGLTVWNCWKQQQQYTPAGSQLGEPAWCLETKTQHRNRQLECPCFYFFFLISFLKGWREIQPRELISCSKTRNQSSYCLASSFILSLLSTSLVS